jgi:hypothetical protein
MAAAVLAAAFVLVLPLPPRPLDMPHPSAQRPTAVGAFHIHTDRSDGSGTPDEVASAAARAGLQFVILTDHGDGTRAPNPPRYRSGVLVIDAVELSTARGHYIAVGLPQSPYPLRGEPRDVIEDVRRLGGFGVVAHPDSAKPALQWHDWDAPFDALEWLNADTEWRDEAVPRLARALVQYPLRPVETLGSLLDRPDVTLGRWDAATTRRPVVALAGADAHARAGWMDEDANGYRRTWFLRIPSYTASFGTFAMRAEIDRPFGSDAAADAAQIITSLKTGRLYSGIDVVASPIALEFSVTGENRSAGPGELLDVSGPVSILARSNATTGGVIVLRKDGNIIAQQSLPELSFHSPSGNGTYRVEVHLANAPGEPPVPWILSNPIYVRPTGWGAAPPLSRPVAIDARGIQGGPWHVEKSDDATAHVFQKEPPNGPVAFEYRLGTGERSGSYAALGISVGDALTTRTRLEFRAHASAPMRISIQARRPRSGERWQRSIYLDTTPRDILVPLDELRPVGNATATFDPRLVDTVLFVADLDNAKPGTTGNISISDLRVER